MARRDGLLLRASHLIERFDRIERRATEWSKLAKRAENLGLGGENGKPSYSEIAQKARANSVEAIGVYRHLKISKLGVLSRFNLMMLEKFAASSERHLDVSDSAASAAKKLWKQTPESSRSTEGEESKHLTREQAMEIASLADQLAEAEVKMMLNMRVKSLRNKSSGDSK
jgi:hypothetical protein